MAQVAVQDRSTTSFDANSGSVSHIVGSGEQLIVGVLLEGTDTSKEVDNIQWEAAAGDLPLAFFGAFSPTHGKLRLEVWYLADIAVAETRNVTVTLESGNAQKTGVCAVSVTNANSPPVSSPQDTDEGSDADGSVSVTQVADDLAMCFAGHNDASGAFTATGDASELEDFIAASQFNMWCAEGDTAGATTLSWTQSASKENSTFGFIVEAAQRHQTRRIIGVIGFH